MKRTWAPRGQTPVLYTSVDHNHRLNLIGTLCLSPGNRRIKLCLQSYWGRLGGPEVQRFLEHLLQHVHGAVVLLWDRHPMHQRREVKAFLRQHRRLHPYEFPTSTPELNPTEGVWSQVSEYTASTAPHTEPELQANVMGGVARTRRSAKRLWACLLGSELPWKPKRHEH